MHCVWRGHCLFQRLALAPNWPACPAFLPALRCNTVRFRLLREIIFFLFLPFAGAADPLVFLRWRVICDPFDRGACGVFIML